MGIDDKSGKCWVGLYGLVLSPKHRLFYLQEPSWVEVCFGRFENKFIIIIMIIIIY